MALGKNGIKLFFGTYDLKPEIVYPNSAHIVCLCFYDFRNTKGVVASARRISELRTKSTKLYTVIVSPTTEDFSQLVSKYKLAAYWSGQRELRSQAWSVLRVTRLPHYAIFKESQLIYSDNGSDKRDIFDFIRKLSISSAPNVPPRPRNRSKSNDPDQMSSLADEEQFLLNFVPKNSKQNTMEIDVARIQKWRDILQMKNSRISHLEMQMQRGKPDIPPLPKNLTPIISKSLDRTPQKHNLSGNSIFDTARKSHKLNIRKPPDFSPSQYEKVMKRELSRDKVNYKETNTDFWKTREAQFETEDRLSDIKGLWLGGTQQKKPGHQSVDLPPRRGTFSNVGGNIVRNHANLNK